MFFLLIHSSELERCQTWGTAFLKFLVVLEVCQKTHAYSLCAFIGEVLEHTTHTFDTHYSSVKREEVRAFRRLMIFALCCGALAEGMIATPTGVNLLSVDATSWGCLFDPLKQTRHAFDIHHPWLQRKKVSTFLGNMLVALCDEALQEDVDLTPAGENLGFVPAHLESRGLNEVL